MTQNGLKWILNTTLKSMKFCRSYPPPVWKISYFFFFLNEGFPNTDRKNFEYRNNHWHRVLLSGHVCRAHCPWTLSWSSPAFRIFVVADRHELPHKEIYPGDGGAAVRLQSRAGIRSWPPWSRAEGNTKSPNSRVWWSRSHTTRSRSSPPELFSFHLAAHEVFEGAELLGQG